MARLPFDDALLEFAHAHASEQLDTIMLALSDSARGRVIGPIVAVLMIVALVRRHGAAAMLLGIGWFGAVLLSSRLKLLFGRERPDLWVSLDAQASYAFPSGHSMGSMAFATALCVLAWQTRWRWPVLVAALGFSLAVGVSRVYLGVHWPTDVLGGWLFGAAWVLAVARFLPRDMLDRERRVRATKGRPE